MEQIYSIEKLRDAIKNSPIVLVYFSAPYCNVCKVLKPKIIELFFKYQEVKTIYVDLEQLKEASGEYSVFSLPTILVFIEGKEYLRESRNISLYEFEEKVQRYYSLFYS
jgi:thiol-disulfide isomerase/thioredoxin